MEFNEDSEPKESIVLLTRIMGIVILIVLLGVMIKVWTS